MTRWLLMLVALSALTVASCAELKPWERGVLADRKMRTALCAEREAAREHVYSVREGAQGGGNQAGSGCGCD